MWPAFGPARSISSASNSHSCFALVAEWLNTCLTTHEQCKASAEERSRATLPQRVLKLDLEDDKVYLYVPVRKEQQPYAALSYCWGGELQEKIKTTKRTVVQNSQGIDLQSLPLTVQHAITIARALGLAYLWVDSLCIIQDSAADWERESASMCDIYSNATITISADGSLDCQGGCFVSSAYRNMTIATMPCPDSNGGTTNVYLRRLGIQQEANGSHASQNVSRPRLDTRGWTMQERLLSPRVLHCTSTELVWQCSARVSCECQIVEEEAAGFTFEPFRTAYVKDVVGEGKRFDWRRIVVEYTQRDLSQQTDRLPAISGFAAAISKTLPHAFASEDYFFGLWRPDIVRNMLWNVVSGTDNSSSEGGSRQSTRFTGRYAPSWSWASVTGGIAYIDELHGQNRYESGRKTQAKSKMILQTANIVLDTQNAYGPGSGELVVVGELVAVVVRQTPEHKLNVFHTAYTQDSSAIGIALPDVLSSRDMEVVPNKEYQWLIVVEISYDGSTVYDLGSRLVGLLLERLPSPSGDLYRRVGLVIGHIRIEGPRLKPQMVQGQYSLSVRLLALSYSRVNADKV
jgi:hypothetical protein